MGRSRRSCCGANGCGRTRLRRSAFRSDDPPVPLAPDVLTEDGHCTYLPDAGGKTSGRWVLSDTYPDRARHQHPYLFDVTTGTRHPLGHFASPPMYTGDIRCDTHPRSSPDGKQVRIDSPHGGEGRQMYLIDVSEIVSLRR